MCGIAGAVTRAPLPAQTVDRVLDTLRHRGPDARGSVEGRLGDQRVNLMHTRLSIIDLDPRANQPFCVAGISLTFNGEIYNYQELRHQLQTLGHKFTTTSDTEVVIEAYKQWGTDCVRHFDGMWALALLDERQNILFLSRDRFGEKPFFWSQIGDDVFFASEVKALVALSGNATQPDLEQVHRYLVNGYKSLCKKPGTWHKHVNELPAGHSAVIQAGDIAVAPEPYWSLSFQPEPMTRNDAVRGVRDRLFSGLSRRLRADVPLAFCLSGGVDSGALACIAAKEYGVEVHAFSIVDEDPRYDERDTLMHTVSEIGCRHTVIKPCIDGFLGRMSKLVADHDAPVATISYYVHSFLSEAIHDHGYKIALSGTGADELFTGYYDHYNFWLAGMAANESFSDFLSDWRSGYGELVRNPFLKNPMDIVERPDRRDHIYLDRDIFNGLMKSPSTEQFEETGYCTDTLRGRMLNELNHEIVPVLLQEDDLNSMRVSVENRSPFLDHELARFAFSIPTEHLIKDGMPKWILRAAVEGYLPDPARLDRRKRGFNASIDTVLNRKDPKVRDWLCSSSQIFDIVDRESFVGFLDQEMADNSFSKFLFSFVSAKMFLNQFGPDTAGNVA